MITLGPADVITATSSAIRTGPTLSGTLRATREATVRAQIPGTILRTLVRQGDRVGSGALLATIDDGALRDVRQSSLSALSSAEASLAIAQREEARQQELSRAGIVSRRELDMARQNVSTARSMVAQARGQSASSREQLAYTEVRTKLGGVVSEKMISVGDIVQPGSALFMVVDPADLELEAAVPAETLGMVQIGSPVEFSVTGYSGRTFTGTINRINPIADPATRQVRVYAALPNRENVLVSGLYAEGRVASQSSQGIVVPLDAIDRRMGAPAVLRVTNGKVERVEVGLGVTDESADRAEIVRGVNSGDILLIGAAQRLTPGTAVRVVAKASVAGVVR